MDRSPAPRPALSPSSEARAVALVGLAVVAVFYASYFPILNGALLYDDFATLVDNPSLKAWATSAAPPPDGPVAGRPLANFTFACNWLLLGSSGMGFRVVNAALHLAAGAWLFFFLRRWGAGVWAGWDRRGVAQASGVVAALWVLHPVHTATVGYIAQRTEVLLGLFTFMAWWAWVKSWDRHASYVRWLAVVALAAVAGAACKEGIAVLPIALACLERSGPATSWKAVWERRGRFLVGLAVVLWAWQAWLFHGSSNAGMGTSTGITPWRYAYVQAWLVWDYLRLCVWPDPLNFARGPGPLYAQVPWVFPVTTGAVLVAVAWAWRVRPRWAIGPTLFGLSLAVTSSFVPLVVQPMAENRIYVGSAVVLAGVVFVVSRFAPRLTLIGGVGVALLFAWLTHQRYQVQSDAVALWEDTVRQSPEHAMAHNNLGAAWLAKRDWAEAEKACERARALDDRLGQPYFQLSRLRLQQDRVEEARQLAREAWQRAPYDVNFATRLLTLALGAGDLATVEEVLPDLLARRYVSAEAYTGAAWLASRKGQKEQRDDWLKRARQVDPENAVLRRFEAELRAAGER